MSWAPPGALAGPTGEVNGIAGACGNGERVSQQRYATEQAIHEALLDWYYGARNEKSRYAFLARKMYPRGDAAKRLIQHI